MAETFTADLFPLSTDETPWRKLTSDFVSVDTFKGQEVLTIELHVSQGVHNLLERNLLLP